MLIEPYTLVGPALYMCVCLFTVSLLGPTICCKLPMSRFNTKVEHPSGHTPAPMHAVKSQPYRQASLVREHNYVKVVFNTKAVSPPVQSSPVIVDSCSKLLDCSGEGTGREEQSSQMSGNGISCMSSTLLQIFPLSPLLP